jgi:UDP-glucose 4-epimerase
MAENIRGSQIILVTGATGFIGRQLVNSLLSYGYTVRAVARRISDVSHPRLEWVQEDLQCSADRWAQLVEGTDAVCHLAWSSVPHTANLDPVGDLECNVVGTLRLAQAAARAGARLVFASSGGTVYGRLGEDAATETSAVRPTSYYGVSKLAAEQYALLCGQAAGVQNVMLRISNLYGPGQGGSGNFGAIANFCARAVVGDEIVIWGDGKVVRDYVYVSDVTRAIIMALQAKSPPPILNVGSGEGQSLAAILDAIRRVVDRPLLVRYEPSRGYDVPRSVLDVSLAEQSIGWTSLVSFEDGIRHTLSAHASPLR